MPHVIVKLGSGRTEGQKGQLADALTQTIVRTLGLDDATVSVAIEDIDPSDWTESVYKPDILGNSARIYKKPGYDPFGK